MKKLLFPLLLLVAAFSITLVSCDKSKNDANDVVAQNETERLYSSSDDWNSPIEDYIDDNEDQIEVEDRAASLLTAVQSPAKKLLSTDNCHKKLHEGKEIVINSDQSSFSLTGTEIPEQLTVKGVTKVGKVSAIIKQTGANGFIDTIDENSYNTLSVDNWSANKIDIVIDGIMKNGKTEQTAKRVDSIRTFTIKFLVDVPFMNKDSTLAYKRKTKTVYCIGVNGNEQGRYGTINWDLYLFHRYGNSINLPTGHTAFEGTVGSTIPAYNTIASIIIDSATMTVPKAGDILQREDGTQGFVYSISSTKDAKGKYKVRIYERVCNTATLKKGTWTLQQAGKFGTATTEAVGGFVAKTSGNDVTGNAAGTGSGTWTKFKSKS